MQILSITVLILNLCVTIYAVGNTNGDHWDFIDILKPDDKWTCDTVGFYNKWIHFAINALSTILLGASNYCAQLLVAPTRTEINKAYSNKTWLDVGIQSVRNLRKAKGTRQILWVILMLSSGLLHLL
jgi:hypothetical protein